MASSIPLSSQYSLNFLQFPVNSPQLSQIWAGISLSRAKCEFSRDFLLLRRSWDSLRPITGKEVGIKCFTESTEERESVGVGIDKDGDDEVKNDATVEEEQRIPTANAASGDSLSLGIRDPVYEVVEVRSNGMVSTRKINRRYLLKSGGLRPRDIRTVDPSLWLTNSMPSLL